MSPLDFKLKQPGATLMVALSAAFPAASLAAGAGRVDFAVGDVKAVAADGRSRALGKGAEVNSGETIDTGSGRAQVRFTDGAQVSLQPQTQFRIDEYKFAGKTDGEEKGFFSLLKGGLRTITGLVGRANRDNYKVTTSVATIGIRGTEYSVSYGNSITVTTGEGTVEVCNAAGCLIINSGETAYVANNSTQPVISEKKADLPPPPAQQEAPKIVVSETTTSTGEPVILATTGGFTLPTGAGYTGALSVGSSWNAYTVCLGGLTCGGADAYLAAGGGELVAVADGAAEGFLNLTATFEGQSWDDTIGIGRYVNGDVMFETYGTQTLGPGEGLHVAVGKPTSISDMAALSTNNVTASYSMLGATTPTFSNGTASGLGTGTVTGAMNADFGNGVVAVTMNVAFATANYQMDGTNVINGSGFNISPSVVGSGSACSGASGCLGYVNGFFAGTAASHAGLVYKIYDDVGFYINGAAAFKKSGPGVQIPW